MYQCKVMLQCSNQSLKAQTIPNRLIFPSGSLWLCYTGPLNCHSLFDLYYFLVLLSYYNQNRHCGTGKMKKREVRKLS